MSLFSQSKPDFQMTYEEGLKTMTSDDQGHRNPQ